MTSKAPVHSPAENIGLDLDLRRMHWDGSCMSEGRIEQRLQVETLLMSEVSMTLEMWKVLSEHGDGRVVGTRSQRSSKGSMTQAVAKRKSVV